MRLRLYLDVASHLHNRASYALELLATCLGISLDSCRDIESADIIYAPPPADGWNNPDDRIWIYACNVADWDDPTLSIAWLEEIPFFYKDQPPRVKQQGTHILADIVYSTYVLLTGVVEQNHPKDPWGGMLVAEQNAAPVQKLFGQPFVHHYLKLFKFALSAKFGNRFQPLPMWPEGKKYAIVLSHDVDAPYAHNPPRYFGENFARAFQTTHYLRAVKTAFDALWRLPAYFLRKNDPNFCFDRWQAFERTLRTHSCFYVASYHWPEIDSDPFDVNYSLTDRYLVPTLRELADAGWEIGLHASIGSKDFPGRFQIEGQRLADAVGLDQLKGVRQHYLCLDSEVPEVTLQSQAEANFLYDSSLGFNYYPGFRRGIALPFKPFNRLVDEAVPIWELPLTLMDGTIFYYQNVSFTEGQKAIGEHLANVAENQGAAVLDWHLRILSDNQPLNGAGLALQNVLNEVASSNEIFWASPAELIGWWEQRLKRIGQPDFVNLT